MWELKDSGFYRCNTSLLVDYSHADGKHNYILIDVGKTFREQVLRWFTHHKIPRVDSVSSIFISPMTNLKFKIDAFS